MSKERAAFWTASVIRLKRCYQNPRINTRNNSGKDRAQPEAAADVRVTMTTGKDIRDILEGHTTDGGGGNG